MMSDDDSDLPKPKAKKPAAKPKEAKKTTPKKPAQEKKRAHISDSEDSDDEDAKGTHSLRLSRSQGPLSDAKPQFRPFPPYDKLVNYPRLAISFFCAVCKRWFQIVHATCSTN